MDELHAAIAAYLCQQRRTSEVRRTLADVEPARQLFGYREGQYPTPRCLVCSRAVDDDDGCFDLADMQRRRQCAEHYCPL